MKLRKVSIEDVIGNLPDIIAIDFVNEFANQSYDLFIQAVGFEERTAAMATRLSRVREFKVKEAILLYFDTNVDDNLFYEKTLKENLSTFCGSIVSFKFDDSFEESIRSKLTFNYGRKARVIVDYSTLTSKLILFLTRLLFQEDIELVILYTEGSLYHPTEEEFTKWNSRPEEQEYMLTQTQGIGKVSISADFNGGTKENQDMVICFPSFTADRTEAIISSIDDLILKQNDRHRLVWIIGDPHMDDLKKREDRKQMQIAINRLIEKDVRYDVCTFDYKKTLEMLNHIYGEFYSNYHINISNLGSKMQSLGIALFSTLRRDVTVHYSEPKKYNPGFYSEGIKDYWMINVGETKAYCKELFKVDTITV